MNAPDRERWLPFVSEEGSGRIRFIQVRFADGAGGVDRSSDDLRRLRTDLDEAIARSGLPGLTWGVTGIPAIEACYSVAGEEAYILKVRVASPQALESLLSDIRALVGVSTRTTVVLSTPFEDRLVL